MSRSPRFPRRDFLKKSLSAAAAFTIVPRARPRRTGRPRAQRPADPGGHRRRRDGPRPSQIRGRPPPRRLRRGRGPPQDRPRGGRPGRQRLPGLPRGPGPPRHRHRPYRHPAPLARPDRRPAAAEAGKDIWCEKPMTRTIGEGRKVVEAVRRNGRIFRINTWFRFNDHLLRLRHDGQADQEGRPEPAARLAAQGHGQRRHGLRLEILLEREDLPAAPARPHGARLRFLARPRPVQAYHPHRVHQTFRGYWDYDGGGLGDMGMHYLDPVQYLLEKDGTSPVAIEADAPQQHPDACGSWRRVRLDLRRRLRDRARRREPRRPRPRSSKGREGKLYRGFRSDVPGLREKVAALPDPEPQVTDFAEAVRTRRRFALNEENAHRSCTLVNLAKIARPAGPAAPIRSRPRSASSATTRPTA